MQVNYYVPLQYTYTRNYTLNVHKVLSINYFSLILHPAIFRKDYISTTKFDPLVDLIVYFRRLRPVHLIDFRFMHIQYTETQHQTAISWLYSKIVNKASNLQLSYYYYSRKLFRERSFNFGHATPTYMKHSMKVPEKCLLPSNPQLFSLESFPLHGSSRV